MSRDSAGVKQVDGRTMLCIEVADLFEYLPETDAKVLAELSIGNGSALRMLADQLVLSETPWDERPDAPESGRWFSSEFSEQIRLALKPLLGPALDDTLERAIAARDRALASEKLLDEWVGAFLHMEADRMSGRASGFNFEQHEKARNAAIAATLKRAPWRDRRPQAALPEAPR